MLTAYRLAWLGGIVSLSLGIAYATPVSYDFTGVIDTRFSTIYSLPPELVPGASFSGSVTYDTQGLTDLDPGPDHSFFLGAIVDFQFDVGGVHWQIDPARALGQSWNGIGTNIPAPLTGELNDQIDINSTNAFTNTDYINGLSYAWVGLGAHDVAGTLASADPLTDLSVFPVGDWIMQWTFVNDPIAPTTYYAQAVGSLTSLTPVTVSEPATWSLLLVALGGVLCAGARRRSAASQRSIAPIIVGAWRSPCTGIAAT